MLLFKDAYLPECSLRNTEDESSYYYGSETELVLGEKCTLKVYLERDAKTSPSSFVWTSSNKKVATVDKKGVVKTVGPGTAVISASIPTIGLSTEHTVNVKIINVTGVKLNKTSATLRVGAEQKLTATISPSNATYKSVTWSSSDTSVATVDENGNVKALKAGTATITVKTSDQGKTATCKITVKPPVSSVSLNKTSLSLKTGSSESLTATVKPDNAYDKAVSWSSSNTSVATVDSKGTIKAIKAGTATITVKTKDQEKTATGKVTVKHAVTGVSLNKSKLSLKAGTRETLVAVVSPDNAYDKGVTWSSNNTSVATVDKNGIVKGIKAGKATITVKTSDQGKTATCEVTVSAGAVAPGVEYQAKVVGDAVWQSSVRDGAQAGTTGKSLIMEAYRIHIIDKDTGAELDPGTLGVKYRGHIQSYGWEKEVKDFAVAGREGEGKRIEALELSLTGSKASEYDIYYCLHVQSYGWLNWAKNGERAGTASMSKRVEAIRIQLVKKGGAAPKKLGSRNEAFLQGVYAKYSAKVIGQKNWLAQVKDGAIAGTTGKSLIMEAFKLDADQGVKVYYKGHIQSYGWEKDWKTNNQVSGREGEGKRIEAIQMKLDDASAKKYDIYYCMHVQSFGWLNWAKNGESAGSANLSRRVEAIAVQILPKGSKAPGKLGSRADSFIQGVSAKSAMLSKTSATVGVGKAVQLSATVTPSNVTMTKHVWKSSNTAVATVDANGKVTGKKKGSATITFTTQDGYRKATCKITVN